VDVRGELLHVIEAGTGPATLLLHGFPGNAFSWRPVQARLAARLRTMAVDAVGFGYSTRSPNRPLDGDTHADRIADLVGTLGLERVHLVGVSWGGELAQRVAIRHPQLVDRMVLIAAVDAGRPLRLGTVDLLTLRAAARVPALARRVVGRFLGRRARGSGFGAEEPGSGELGRDELGHGYIDPLLLPGTRDLLPRFIRATRDTPPADVTTIRAPTLVLSPLADRIVPPAVEASLARRIPGAELAVLQGASHSVQFERPREVAELVLGFIERPA
jgi:pimeloyl-ACP methyl ester carboxylesterase